MFGGLGDLFGGIGEALAKVVDAIVSLPSLIANALVWLFDKIVNGIVALGNFLVDTLKWLGGFIVDALTALGNLVIGIAGAIWDFLRDPLGSINKGIDSLVSFFRGLIDGLVDMFKDIFIPGDGYFDGKVSDTQEALNDKIHIDGYKDALEGTASGTAVRSADTRALGSMTMFGATFDFNFLEQLQGYRQYTDWILYGLTFWYLLNYNINMVYKLIRGGDLDGGGGDD